MAALSFYQIPKGEYHTYPELLALPIVHYGYVETTTQTATITIVSKYVYTYGGYTRFMVVDSAGKHYTMENSIWFWRWNSIEDWESIPTGKPTRLQYYGWRIAPLGIFPNIVYCRGSSDPPIANHSGTSCEVDDYIWRF